MNGTRKGMGWGARLLIALVFILVGAGAAIWGLAHYPKAARIAGVASAPPLTTDHLAKAPEPPPPAASAPVQADSARIAALEQRLSQVENSSQRAEGFEQAIEHDTVLQPWLCGGPLVNLDGEAIGLNIARAGRVTTYALSSKLVKRLIENLKSTPESAAGNSK